MESDILEPSEASRRDMDYYAHAPDTRAMLERLAAERPTTCNSGAQPQEARPALVVPNVRMRLIWSIGV